LLKLYDFIKTIKDWNIDEKMLFDINRIYSESRYPSNIGLLDGQLPSIEKAKEILEFAQKIEGVFKNMIMPITAKEASETEETV